MDWQRNKQCEGKWRQNRWNQLGETQIGNIEKKRRLEIWKWVIRCLWRWRGRLSGTEQRPLLNMLHRRLTMSSVHRLVPKQIVVTTRSGEDDSVKTMRPRHGNVAERMIAALCRSGKWWAHTLSTHSAAGLVQTYCFSPTVAQYKCSRRAWRWR